jgi:beta-glucosidase
MEMEPADVLAAVGRDKYSIRWTGTLTVTATGEYQMIVRTNRWNRTGRVRMFLDGQELDFTGGPVTQITSTQQAPPPGMRRPSMAKVQLDAGRKYALRVEFRQTGTGGSIQLSWVPPAAAAIAEAEALVKDSDVAIVCVGLSSDLEGEEMRGLSIPGFRGGDRTALELPEPQEALVKAAVATGKPIVVVLTSGSAVALNYAAAHARAVLAAWYGGEEAGSALAEVLAGASNPAGRLPVTFYTSADQLPPFTDYTMKGRTYRYFTGTPLYPFGFGLSYSSFAYADLSAKRTAAGAEVRVAVSNTSPRDGDEVVQFYVAGGSADGAPIRSLRGFQRVRLKAGERRELTFTVPRAELPTSPVEISVGGGQPLAGIPHVKGTI